MRRVRVHREKPRPRKEPDTPLRPLPAVAEMRRSLIEDIEDLIEEIDQAVIDGARR